MRTIAIINQKGGCGKTTTAINLGATLAKGGARVLLVDMDPQSHCAAGLGVPEHRIESDIGDAMLAVGKRPLDLSRLLWRVGRDMDLAPSRMRLAGLEAARGGLADLEDKERRLASVLHELRGHYDVACIDCPPSIGLLTYNALAAADLVLIPVETSFFSLQGATRQVQTVKTLARRLGVRLPTWVLATIHDEANPVAADLLAEMHRRFADRVAPVIVHRDARLREAASFGQAVADYAPDSQGACDYAALASWVRGLGECREALSDGAGVETAEAHDTPEEPEVHVVGEASAPSEAGVGAGSGGLGTFTPDVKAVTRAEDVARRAQEFLRKVALSRGTQPAAFSSVAREEGVGAAAVGPLRLVESLRAPEVTPSPGVSRLYGVRETNQGMLFVQPARGAQRAAIAAEFNDWSATAHPMRLNVELGVFELCLRLPRGKFRYRVVIDEHWGADPYNDHCEPNPFGESDSIVCVGDGVPASV